MKTFRHDKKGTARAVLLGVVLLGTTACGLLMNHDVERPSAGEFGMGPRPSVQGIYTVSLESDQPVRPRQMQTLRVRIQDTGGTGIDGAAVTVDGGMPEHGHGLPTRPRVTANPGGGIYEIDGVRFNMGGWWEFRLAISAPSGSDVVTFNLAL